MYFCNVEFRRSSDFVPAKAELENKSIARADVLPVLEEMGPP